MIDADGTVSDAALQHGPRPLPLFLEMLRSQTAGHPARAAKALAGLSAYQGATRKQQPALPVLHETGGAQLLGVEGTGAAPPIVFIPSLINPSSILDLSPETSLVRSLAADVRRTTLVDWGRAEPERRHMNLAAHVEELLLPLIARLETPPILVGYCLGGTLAFAAAALMPVAGVVTIAAPWRFAGYGHEARGTMRRYWALNAAVAAASGLLPMEALQAGFWALDPARTIAKFESFADSPRGSKAADAFVALEDWANAGEPLPYAAARDLFEDFVEHDAPGRNGWRVGGRTIDPHSLACPTLEIISTTDRIVPAATAAGLPRHVEMSAGHVGMIVGRSRDRLRAVLTGWIAAL